MTHKELQKMLLKSKDNELFYTYKSWEDDTLVPYLEKKVITAPLSSVKDSWTSSSEEPCEDPPGIFRMACLGWRSQLVVGAKFGRSAVKGRGDYPTGNLPKCTQRTVQGRCWQGRSIEQPGVEAEIHNTGRPWRSPTICSRSNGTAEDSKQLKLEDVPDQNPLPLDLRAKPLDFRASHLLSLASQPNKSSGNAPSLVADLPPAQVFFRPWEKPTVVDDDLEESDLISKVNSGTSRKRRTRNNNHDVPLTVIYQRVCTLNTLRNASPVIRQDIQGVTFYKEMDRYLLTCDELDVLGFPRPDAN
ncbi:hypothetical protein DAPPUDRAFT_102762 [Daphnia pulex]|uniref:Uncharacterized protein n=1 Tax=Daphnia pulex TaxID=6669 RepID=E9GHF7_DAPPU|nr:hypothetical protein DAPPUDRAFT_102762 [Daphnia pulex]|eukprot:EFX81187.1 hypothetical protein DAPPUDRAFT_102762 [Daphnia pulex]